MREVDQVIARRLDSGVPLVGQVSSYIIAAGGKRLRPALLLLTCGALGYTGPQRFNLAAVVEFIHTATLLHDDVVDDSAMRRGNATANETFGNPASVLVGDFLVFPSFSDDGRCTKHAHHAGAGRRHERHCRGRGHAIDEYAQCRAG